MGWVVPGTIFVALLVNFLVTRRPRRLRSYANDPDVVKLVAQLPVGDREQIASLVRSGKHIGAIQLLRERVPADLRLARRAVEHLGADYSDRATIPRADELR